MERILYLECYSGISGDMTVGALLDLGADREVLQRTLESLHVDGYHLHFGRVKKCGIDAFDFDVHLEDQGQEAHVHEPHDHADHCHSHDGGEGHGHEAQSHEAHGHEAHTHPHLHRNLQDILDIIDRMDATEYVKDLSKKMFDIVAQAESKAHGVPVEAVHFHEVGAVDSIVDIISTAVCIENLGISRVIVSPLSEGHGYVRCQHGTMPVPVPATANIAAACGLKLRLTEQEGEMVTPTGAAIAAALKTDDCLPEQYRILKIGLGAGKKDFKHANLLRAMLIEAETGTGEQAGIEAGAGTEAETGIEAEAGIETKEGIGAEVESESSHDALWVLETNIDDCAGEAMGYTMERLLAEGACDVWYTPIYMKKNRPAYQLSVLCRGNSISRMEDQIFTHTTSIGIRRHPVERTALEREERQAETIYGPVHVKLCRHRDAVYCYPEYDSVRRLCQEKGLDFQSVYHEAARWRGEEG